MRTGKYKVFYRDIVEDSNVKRPWIIRKLNPKNRGSSWVFDIGLSVCSTIVYSVRSELCKTS